MTKAEIYEVRTIIEAMFHNRNADTQKSATFDKFIELYERGVEICNKSINKMKPME